MNELMKTMGHARVFWNASSVMPHANRCTLMHGWAARTFAVIALVSGLARTAAGASFTSYQVATTAQAQGNATIRHGILILAVPTLVLFALIAAVVYKRRNVSR